MLAIMKCNIVWLNVSNTNEVNFGRTKEESSFISGSYLGFLNRTVRVSELQCNQNVRTLLVTNPHSAISKPGHTVCWP